MMYAAFRLRTLLIGILCVALVSVATAIIYRTLSARTGPAGEARALVAECSKSGSDHSACYESEVPNLYPRLAVADIFDVIRQIRAQDPSYQYCHVLGHKLGERVVAEDPSSWVNAIPLNPADGLCSNGFIHGVVGGRFRAEVLDDATIKKFLPDFTIACQPHNGWNPTNLDRAICYHGMGHLFDFITNAAIPKALDLCSKVAPQDYMRVCTQGVFMQIYQPLEPDDFALIAQMKVKPATTTVQRYCSAFRSNSMAEGSCIEESWPLQQPHITDGTAVERLCSWEPNETEKDVCYISMSSIIGRMSLGSPQKAAAACSALPPDRAATCFSYSAEAVLEENRDDASKAVSLCRMATPDIAAQCLDLLIGHATFMFGNNSTRLHAFCDAVPENIRSHCEATIAQQ